MTFQIQTDCLAEKLAMTFQTQTDCFAQKLAMTKNKTNDFLRTFYIR